MKKDESKILIIYTGGTIGMIQDPNKKTLKPFDFNEITCEVPELNRIECEIDTISFKNAIDSSNVNTANIRKCNFSRAITIRGLRSDTSKNNAAHEDNENNTRR